ncbi:hypothetical protein DRN67_00830 [Candidatus Micrarchaeota archaeon]|nr:MAG: hypothetical protein DRN67_00830 [Candidatus Micrarchaeota archaeon]
MKYPTVEEIEEYNVLVLGIIRVKKADRPQVLSRQKIMKAIEVCESVEGDIYQKAAVLLQHLVRAHAFASGNRRTAFVAAKAFVLDNGGSFNIPDDPSYAAVMLGIREGRYNEKEIAEWIKNGKIRKSSR